jgi:archaellin
MFFMNVKKGAQGIGVLIAFITVILVVSIAAAVISNTLRSLESSSLDVSEDSKQKLSKSVEVAQIVVTRAGGVGGFGPGSNVSAIVGLRLGSDVTKISDLQIQFGTETSSQSLSSSGGSSYSGTQFGYTYLVQGSKFKDGYINQGDLVEFTFTYTGSGMAEDETISYIIQDSSGALYPLTITLPKAILASTVSIYP